MGSKLEHYEYTVYVKSSMDNIFSSGDCKLFYTLKPW